MARSPSDKPKAPKTKGPKAPNKPSTKAAQVAGASAILPETTGTDQAKLTPPSDHPKARVTSFQPGQSGNLTGRPRGIRHKLSTSYLTDLEADWRVNGVAAIVKMREDKPVEYVKAVAACVPKAFDLGDDEDDDGRKIIGVALITRDAIEAIIERGREEDED